MASVGPLAFALAVIAACGGQTKQAGGLEVIVETNLPSSSYNELTIDVAQGTGNGQWDTLFHQAQAVPNQLTLPTRLAIQAGSSSNQQALITVTAFQNVKPIVQNVAEVQVPTDHVGEIVIYLATSCTNQLSCPTGSTCNPSTGMCDSDVVTSVAEYQPQDTPGNLTCSSDADCAAGLVCDPSLGCITPIGHTGGGNDSGTIQPDSGTPGPDAGNGGPDATMPGCTASSDCPSGETCSGGRCVASAQDSGTTCTTAAQTCGASGGCFDQTTCLCTPSCPAGSTCQQGKGCIASGGGCNAQTCSGGCCDASNMCQMNNAAACGSGGGACAPCPSGATCSAGTCQPAPQGCCTANGAACVPGMACPVSAYTCGKQGVCVACGGAGQACCNGSGCSGTLICNPSSGMPVCAAGMGGSDASTCNVASESTPGPSNFAATLNGQSFPGTDGYITVQQNGAQITMVGLAFSNATNACGYAESGALKAGSSMATFTFVPPAGTTSLAQLAGNMYPVFSTTLVTETGCNRVTYTSTQCDSGLLIKFGAATSSMGAGGQIMGSCTGTCSGGPCTDSVSSSMFNLPVCAVTAPLNACCP
jgi:hypothetical protein